MPLWLSTLSIYPDIMKLCIQTPVVMEFQSTRDTVNATTMNVGRLWYKGQLSHREVGKLTGDQQTNKLKGIMSPISTLTPPHTLIHWGSEACKITCYPPNSSRSFHGGNTLNRNTLKTAQSHPETEHERTEQRLTNHTGFRGLIQIPKYGHAGRDFQSMWNVDNNHIIPQCQLTF